MAEDPGSTAQCLDVTLEIGFDRLLAEPHPDAVTRALRPRAESVTIARDVTRTTLGRWGLGALCADVALVVSELVTNAVVHAGTTSELRVRLADGVLTVIVRDRGGPGEPDAVAPAEVHDQLQVHGRGLMLVEALADRWGSERDAVGTTVWFALDLAAAHAPGVQQTG